MNSQDIQSVYGWMSDTFSGINKFDQQSISEKKKKKKKKSKVVGVSFGVQYIKKQSDIFFILTAVKHVSAN